MEPEEFEMFMAEHKAAFAALMAAYDAEIAACKLTAESQKKLLAAIERMEAILAQD